MTETSDPRERTALLLVDLYNDFLSERLSPTRRCTPPTS